VFSSFGCPCSVAAFIIRPFLALLCLTQLIPIYPPSILHYIDWTDDVISSLPLTTQLLEMETTDIQPYVTLNAINRRDFGGVDALELNNITALDVSEPEFLMTFRAKLKHHRWVTPNPVKLFFFTRSSY